MWTRAAQLYERHLRPHHDENNFPSRQLFVLALCRICEPIAFMSIFPYAYRMIETFDLTKDETKISMYAGMLITAFAFAEFSTGMIWGRISDRIGRKPVLIMGLVGTMLSMISFGFARSLSGAIIARALGGLLNGNVGVLQTTVAELVTKKEHQPRAYSIMPFVWCLGSIIGPAMGGALAMPCDSYPWLFARGTIFDTYPFLLPNLVCVLVLLFGIAIGALFLEETHPEKRKNKDWGLRTGKMLLRTFWSQEATPTPLAMSECSTVEDEYGSTAEEEEAPPGYRSIEGSPRLTSTPSISDPDVEKLIPAEENKGFGKTFTKQAILIIIGYGLLAYHSVSFDSLMPTFLSEAPVSTQAVLPFEFTGGFGLSTKTIGFMLAIQGIYSMFATLVVFPLVVRRVGTLNAFRLVLAIWPLLYLAVPYMVLLPPSLQKVGIYVSLLTKITFHVIAFPSNAILLANAAPSRSVLGTINGAAASTACLARAFGPTVTGAIHSAGLKYGYNGPAWWAAGLICACGAFESFWVQEDESNERPSEQDDTICEPLLHLTTVESNDEVSPRRDSLESIDKLDLLVTKA